MIVELDSPMSIYTNLSHEVDRILNTLEEPSSEQKVSEAQSSIRNLLSDVQANLDQRIGELKTNAEWDTFTIAFYGETNAGKSTIIETLRILLKEKTKLTDWQAFKALQTEHGLTREGLDNARQAIVESDQLINDLQTRLTELLARLDPCEAELKSKLECLRNQIIEKKHTASPWQKLLNLFRKLPEELAYAEAARQRDAFEAEKAKTAANLQSQQQSAKAQKITAVQALEHIESGLKKLEPHADGGIIGNGRPDFTLATQVYHFESGQQKFTLLDVPGIEGNEGKVHQEIWEAVQKAHAVFYVTAKAAAPQKGDDGKKGTLEKIREHLGAQTEVWTLYNKRVTNPMQLGNKALISEDEQTSLQVLDEKMREQLGDHYLRSLPLSALPAFLGVSECLILDSLNAKSRDKFLSKFSRDELLAQSNILYFHELLTGDLVMDYKRKIARSNLNKANLLVKNAAKRLTKLQQENLSPLKEQLSQDSSDARDQLDICFKSLQSRLDTKIEAAINHFTSSVRKRLYSRIDDDISNDDFKRALECALEDAQEKVQRDLPEQIKCELEKFRTDVSDVIERFQQFAKELMDSFGKFGLDGLHNKMDLKINIDNGIKVQNLLGVLVGGVGLIFATGGWVIAFGAITLLVSLGKALYAFFSTDYKKSQQRKAVDDNLREISSRMRNSIRADLKKAYPAAQAKIMEIKETLTEPVRQVTRIDHAVLRAISELNNLSNSVATAGIR